MYGDGKAATGGSKGSGEPLLSGPSRHKHLSWALRPPGVRRKPFRVFSAFLNPRGQDARVPDRFSFLIRRREPRILSVVPHHCASCPSCRHKLSGMVVIARLSFLSHSPPVSLCALCGLCDCPRAPPLGREGRAKVGRNRVLETPVPKEGSAGEEEIDGVHADDAVFRGAGDRVESDDGLREVVVHGAQGGEFALEDSLSAQGFGDLEIGGLAAVPRHEIDSAGAAFPDKDAPPTPCQFVEHDVFEDASGIPRPVGEHGGAKARG